MFEEGCRCCFKRKLSCFCKAFFFPKECIIGFESTALLTVLYLNFGKSLKANEHALIFVIFRSLQG